MNKKNIFLFVSLIFSVLLINFVSAGLCKGSDGYYHDCDDFSEIYYNHNFYPNYKTEYYQETSYSTDSIVYIKEDKHNYEEVRASTTTESNLETIKETRDYSNPKIKYDKYGRYYYTENYADDYQDEDYFPTFVNQIDPIHKERRAYFNSQSEDYDDSYDDSSWRYDWEYDDYYYQPRYSYYSQEYNWDW